MLHNKMESQNYSLIYGLQNGCYANRCEHNINLIVHLHQSSWAPDILSIRSNILKQIIYPQVVDLKTELKIFSKPCRIPDSAKVTQKSCSVSRGGSINTSPATSMRLSPNHSNLKREPDNLGVGGGGISSLQSSPRKVQRWAVV